MELIAGPASATPAPATEIKDAARIARNGRDESTTIQLNPLVSSCCSLVSRRGNREHYYQLIVVKLIFISCAGMMQNPRTRYRAKILTVGSMSPAPVRRKLQGCRRKRAVTSSRTSPPCPHSNVKALFFDVFGTLVDWRAGVAREAQLLLQPLGHAMDWTQFRPTHGATNTSRPWRRFARGAARTLSWTCCIGETCRQFCRALAWQRWTKQRWTS